MDECGVFGVCSDECYNYAMENRMEWESKGETIVRKMVLRLGERNRKLSCVRVNGERQDI
eukprot:scaffold463_cov92-Cylindrotheca_fusiformis.AAC.11